MGLRLLFQYTLLLLATLCVEADTTVGRPGDLQDSTSISHPPGQTAPVLVFSRTMGSGSTWATHTNTRIAQTTVTTTVAYDIQYSGVWTVTADNNYHGVETIKRGSAPEETIDMIYPTHVGGWIYYNAAFEELGTATTLRVQRKQQLAGTFQSVTRFDASGVSTGLNVTGSLRFHDEEIVATEPAGAPGTSSNWNIVTDREFIGPDALQRLQAPPSGRLGGVDGPHGGVYLNGFNGDELVNNTVNTMVTTTTTSGEDVRTWDSQHPFVNATDEFSDTAPAIAKLATPTVSTKSFQKVQYKLVLTPDSPAVINWLEVFTPKDTNRPKGYLAKSWTPGEEDTESPVFTIDPLAIDPADTSASLRDSRGDGAWEVLLHDTSFAVDADRDGTIKLASEDASDTTSDEKPFRFWLNDDIDVLVESTMESEEDDRDPDSFLTIVNWESNFISSHRDLEDFARLWINTVGLSDALKPKDDGTADLYLGLQWSDTESTTPAIKIYKHVEVEGGTEYLNNPDVAQQQVNGALAIIDASGQRTNRLVDGTTPYILPPSLFSDLSAAKTKTYLLFEGCKVGKGQLKLVILDKNKQPIGEGPGVWMDLKEPKEFIRRWTGGDADLGSVNSVALDASKSGTFLPPTTDEEKDMILYVHGYNMQEFLKQRWIETTYKRLYWLGYKGRVGGFTWPCAQSALPFDASEENAYKAGAQLHALLDALKNDGYRVHLLGHSQGNVVVGEALRQAGPDSAVAATYIASQAAIPAHCYDAAQPERSGPAAFVPTTANVYRSFYTGAEGENPNLPKTWSADDPAYLTQTQLHGSVEKFVNFFNPQDYALSGNGLNLLAVDGSQPGWLADQRLKPNLGWRYNDIEGFYQMTGPAQSPTITYLSAANPTQRYQIFAYGAQARSLALGASFGIGGLFASNVNLTGAPFNFRNQHIYHSGQFRSFYAQRWQYWRQLLLSCRLPVRTTP